MRKGECPRAWARVQISAESVFKRGLCVCQIKVKPILQMVFTGGKNATDSGDGLGVGGEVGIAVDIVIGGGWLAHFRLGPVIRIQLPALVIRLCPGYRPGGFRYKNRSLFLGGPTARG